VRLSPQNVVDTNSMRILNYKYQVGKIRGNIKLRPKFRGKIKEEIEFLPQIPIFLQTYGVNL